MQLSHYWELIRYYYRLIILLFITIVGGVVGFSLLFLYVSPIYTGTAVVSLLPTQTELAFSQNSVRSTSINPANLLSQTHIEYLTSREVSRLAVDRLSAEAQAAAADGPAPSEPASDAAPGLKDRIATGFRNFRREFRRIYNTINSGKHVPIDPYTDAVLSLQDSIEIEMIEGTFIMEIAVRWPTPEGAAAAANVLAEVYLDRARQDATEASLELEKELRAELARGETNFSSIEQQINGLRLARAANMNFLRVIDTASVPIYPSFPKVVINTVFAIVGWIFVVAFAMIAIDTFSQTLKTKADAMRVFDGRFLGTLKLRRPRSWKRSNAAATLRLLSDGREASGGTMSLGNASESEIMQRFIKQALVYAPQGALKSAANRATDVTPVQEVPVAAPLLLTTPAETERNVVGSGRRITLSVDNSLDDTNTPPPARALGLRNYGGVDDTFSFLNIEYTDWMVLGIRRGEIAEIELTKLIEELHHRGVRHVFGLYLRG